MTLGRQENGAFLVSFPDIPEALTEASTEGEALAQACDCLIAALGGYIGARRAIPRPSPAKECKAVVVPVLTAAKIALYRAMQAKRTGNAALAERLGLSKTAARRLVDLDHRSKIGEVEAALLALG